MNEDKQIEEMTNTLCDIDCKGMKCGVCDSYGCEYRTQAEALYNAGYRKASDLVNEIFADVFKAIRKYYIEAEHTNSVTCELMLDYLKGDIAELKKKYTEEGK